MMLTILLSLMLGAGPVATNGGVVSIKGHHLLAEVAKTERERDLALEFRQQFKSERCMFVLSEHERPHPVQTRKFLLPFDEAWVDAEGTVVEMQERVPPCKKGQDCPEFGGTKPSRYYVYLAAGMLRKLGLMTGDKIGCDLQLTDGTNLRNGPSLQSENAQSARRQKRKGRSRGRRP